VCCSLSAPVSSASGDDEWPSVFSTSPEIFFMYISSSELASRFFFVLTSPLRIRAVAMLMSPNISREVRKASSSLKWEAGAE